MNELNAITARVVCAATVPELLDAGFDAFEIIQQVARACEDRTPELFAAFMMAAGTAVEGRNALTDAPSLPLAPAGPPQVPPGRTTADVARVANQLATLAALVAQRLHAAADQAALPEDRTACQQGAQSASEIHRLLADDRDE